MKLMAGAMLALLVALTLPACDVFLSPDQRVKRAEAQIAAGDYRAATIELKNALQYQPDHVVARTRLAEVEFRQGEIFAAEKDLRRAFELGARTPATAELMAQIQLALGRGADLLAQIESGELPLEGSARAVYRGQAELGLQRFDAALKSFESVDAAGPHANTARIGAAEALAGQGKSDLALQRLDALIVEQPKLASALLARGVIRARRGEFAMAEQDLTSARAKGEAGLSLLQGLNLLAALAEVQLARGNTDAATESHRALASVAPDGVALRVLAARIAMAKQDYAAATAELQRAITIAPDSISARFLLGAALFSQGSPRQAAQQLTQVLQRAPENLEARKLLAQIHIILGRPEAAMEVLLPAQSNDDVRLDLLRGLARMQQGDESGGMADLERAAAAKPDDENLQLDLATAYLKTERPERAIELLTKLARPKDDFRYSGLLISAFRAAGETVKAKAELERLLSARPRDPAVLRLGAGFFLQQHDFVRARSLAQRTVELDPKSVNALLTRAGVESEAGELDDAREWLAKAAAVDGNSGAASMAVAEFDARRGDFAAATRTLEDVRKRDAASVDARLRLVAIYMRQRNTAAAQPVIEELGVLGKDQPEVSNSLGLLYLDTGRYDEALLRFQAATLLDNTNPIYWLNTARAQLSLGNTPVAREALEKALAAQPGWIPAVGTLAMLDVKEGRQAAALQRLAALKSARPNDATARMLEGDVLMAAKEFTTAAEAYEAAGVIKPSASLSVRAYRARQAGGLATPSRPLEQWLAGHPADHAVRLVLAEAYQRSGDNRRAIAQYELMGRSGGTGALMLNNLAWLYFKEGDARAEGVARQAHELAPKVAAIADTYAWILVENGKPAPALELLRLAAAESSEPSIEYHYAVALARTGAKEEAQRRLKDLLSRTPGFAEAPEARLLLESLSGR